MQAYRELYVKAKLDAPKPLPDVVIEAPERDDTPLLLGAIMLFLVALPVLLLAMASGR